MVGECCEGVQGQEEEVLYDDRGVCEECPLDGRELFDPCPAEVDIEEKKEDSEARD